MPDSLTRVLLCLLFASSIAAVRTAAQETYFFKKLLVADTEAKAAAIPADAGGSAPVFVQDVPVLASPEFTSVVTPFLGKPITIELANQLAEAIVTFARENDHVVRPVLPPTQNITAGTLRIAVVVSRYSDISFRGNRWFSQKLLEERLGIKPGDEIRISALDEAVNWINTNPFRHVKVLVNDLPTEPGKANLIVGVQERLPYRAALSVDDTGNPIIGKRRIAAALQFGNLWGRDHQGSYQYLTTDQPDVYQGHSVDYRVPLKWRHFAQFSATHVSVEPVFGGGLFSQKGENVIANLKYTIPLRRDNEPMDLSFGVNFKQSNNNLEFGGTQVLNSKTDTFQANASFSMIKRDARGAWMFGAAVNASPGEVNSRNTDAAFQTARFGASASYVYGTLALQRLLTLDRGWEVFSRGVVQLSSHNLLSNDQLVIGGSGTARGYDENIFAGDKGFVLSHDLMSPVWVQPLRLGAKKILPLETRFVGFLDTARVEYKQRARSDLIFTTLASVGVGVRSSIGTNFSVSFDYGWQLTDLARQPGQARAPELGSRGHVKVVLAF